MMCNLAFDAVKCVATNVGGKMEIDIKRYARVEKVNINSRRFQVAKLKNVKCLMES
jgi:hypothetical protein